MQKFVKITSVLSSVVLLCAINMAPLFAQVAKTKTYSHDKFTITHPAGWEVAEEDGILNFVPKGDFAAITVSVQTGIDFPMEATRSFILEMNEVEDDPKNVKMTKKGDAVQFDYEHIDKVNQIKWVTRIWRKTNEVYLLTINCELSKWETNKVVLVTALDSFRIK